MRSTTESVREYGRGIAGGLLFSLPLLYTMEVWWAGFLAQPARLLVFLAFTFVLLLGYNRFAGLRQDADFAEVVIDSVEELGLGIVISAAVLWVTGRIGAGEALPELVGKVIVEAGLVAIGVSVGTAQLGGDDEEEGLRGNREPHFLGQLVIAFCGAVLFAANVAPTEEIVLIAIETDVVRLIVLAAMSIFLGWMILYWSRFHRADTLAASDSFLGTVAGSLVNYAVALVASAIILHFFGRFDDVAPTMAVAQVIVLALPAALGASAGRLLLQAGS